MFNSKKIYNVLFVFIFTIAIALRVYTFGVFRPLWRDECSLALSIYFSKFIGLWGVLFHTQSAPPIFMTICKIFSLINPLKPEYFLRLFPFISGIIAIFVFYKLTKQLFESKLAIILANFAFAINTKLIYYSHEFKQYSTDVAVTIWCLYYCSKLNISNMSKKHLILNSFLFAILPFLSLPSVFVIAGFTIINIFNKKNFIKMCLLITPTVILNTIYYFITLRPARENMLNNYDFLWRGGFLEFNFNSIYTMITENLTFYFEQCKYIIIPIIMLFIGFVILFKRRKEIDTLILSGFLFVLLASMIHIYPIKDRVSLYLLPFVIIISLLPLSVSKRKITIFINIIFFILLFGNISNYNLINKDFEDARSMTEILKSNYQASDYVIHNDASDSQFFIYTYIYNFRISNNKNGTIQLADYGEDWYYNVLDLLPKNNRYWFFYSYDISTKPVIPFLKNWAHKNGKILLEKEFNNKSYLLYLQL